MNEASEIGFETKDYVTDGFRSNVQILFDPPQRRFRPTLVRLLSVICCASLLASCGGGGGTEEARVVEGTAAVGKPIASGQLTLRCVVGTGTGSTANDGRYRISLTGLTLPCLVSVAGGEVDGEGSEWRLSSAIVEPGTANLTPWTHLVMARVLGGDPAQLGPSISGAELQSKLTAGKLTDAKAWVSGQMGRLLGAEPPQELDPIETSFVAAPGNGMDGLLEQLMNGLRSSGKTLDQASQEIATGELQIEGVAASCKAAVITGFAGNFDDLPVQVPFDPNYRDDQGGEGGSPGGGGGPGQGIGVGLGQFLNAQIRVERADGSIVGIATTDAQKGLVTIVPCGYQGPLHIQVLAKADGSTQYYEESTGQYAPFPVGSTLNAAVPSLTKNVGVTILTEASWQFLLAKYGVNGWRTAANVAEGNEVVRKEFNRFLPKELEISDISRMPVLLNDRTTSGSISDSENGKYGVVNSGLARAAGLLLVGSSNAALVIAQQIGADLCDGVLDYRCNGSVVVAAGDSPAYLIPQLGEFINAGVGDIATGCGSAAVESSSLRIVQIKVDTATFLGSETYEYSGNTPIFLLRNDGKVFLWPTRDRAAESYAPELTFRQLFSQGKLLGATTDGRVYQAQLTVADSSLPAEQWYAAGLPPIEMQSERDTTTVATVDETFSSAFASISRRNDGRAYAEGSNGELENVVRVGVARGGFSGFAGGYFAVTYDGELYAWGDNGGGLLGLGRSDIELESQPRPAQVSIPSVVSVAGRLYGAFAIDRGGDVWGWGASLAEGLSQPTSSSPQKLSLFDSFKPIRQIECAAFSQCAALSSNGDMLIWGYVLGAESGVFRVPLTGGQKATFIGAAGLFAYGLIDDGSIVLYPPFATEPVIVSPDFLPASSGAACTGTR